MGILKLEAEAELNELLRDKSKDWNSKEAKEFKKYLQTMRAKPKYTHYYFVTPNSVSDKIN